ncbi:MAG: hypothetical protein SPF68_08430, partial [Sodaliphilus sp.]|nr:hypothetical protein [Sodaliphilus sp.]
NPTHASTVSHRFRFVGVFVAHTDLTDPTLSFDGGKSHGGSTVCGFLWAHADSTRFNKKMVCGNLCEFVAEKSL